MSYDNPYPFITFMYMKKIISLFALFFCLRTANGQKAMISGDTAYYLNKSYYIGDTVQLAYGSKNDKDFSFVLFGGDMQGYKSLKSDHSKNSLLIDKIFTRKGKVTLRAKDLDYNAGINKLFIDLEGAIDNKELKSID